MAREEHFLFFVCDIYVILKEIIYIYYMIKRLWTLDHHAQLRFFPKQLPQSCIRSPQLYRVFLLAITSQFPFTRTKRHKSFVKSNELYCHLSHVQWNWQWTLLQDPGATYNTRHKVATQTSSSLTISLCTTRVPWKHGYLRIAWKNSGFPAQKSHRKQNTKLALASGIACITHHPTVATSHIC